jgi:putative spermidine/putrescine transport system permease protein
VTLPAVRPTLAAAAFIGFLVSWSQYGSSLAVGAGRPMLPLVMLPFIGSDPQVAAVLALLFLAPAVLALVLASRAARSPL